jgi:uncharacterized protein YbbK (DUF523 family)
LKTFDKKNTAMASAQPGKAPRQPYCDMIEKMAHILVSACLLGQPVRYDGSTTPCRHPLLAEWVAQGLAVPICPEVAAGFPVPRPPAELRGGDGRAVLAGKARVVQADGRDLTSAFLQGAECALSTARQAGVRLAILKEGSPSCACRWIRDGSFSGLRIAGLGVTAARLEAAGLAIFSENELELAHAWQVEQAG